MKQQKIMINKSESVNKYKNDNLPFFTTEKNVETIDSLNQYKELTNGLSVKARIDLVIRSLGINPEKISLYNKLIKLVQFVPYVMPNYNLFLLGDKGTFKSTPYRCYSEYPKVSPGTPTKAELRGAKNNGDSVPLLDQGLLVFEEIADDTTGGSLSFLKEALQSGVYEDKDGKTRSTATSAVFIGNNYMKIDTIEKLQKSSIITDSVPKTLTDKALLDRINAFIYVDEKFKLKNSLFLETNDEGLNINILMESFIKLRTDEYNINFNKNYEEPRDNSRVLATVKGLCKILYPNNDAPAHIIDGLATFGFHLRYIGSEFKTPFSSSSIPFLVDVMELHDVEEFCLFQDRILIKGKEDSCFKKIALSEWGIEKNDLELSFFKSNSPNISTVIANIDVNNSTNFIIEQEYYPLYSSKHTFSSDGSLIKRKKENYEENSEFNLLLIEKIKLYILNPNTSQFPKSKLRPWKEISESQLLEKIKEIFDISNDKVQLKKSNYSYDDKNIFKLINFSDYITE